MENWRARDVIRWGIIGCGDVTEVKSGPAFHKATGSTLHAVMRRNRALAADYARRHAVPRWYDDAAALIADAEIDAVYIATPPDTHLHYALAVASAGKPAYVEKPMARSAAECRRMVDAFSAARVPLFVAYYRRQLSRFLLGKELVKTGAIGRITSVTYRQSAPYHRKPASWRVDVTSAGGGYFLDLGSHTLDLLDYFFGPLLEVSGSAANCGSPYAAEDNVVMTFKTPGGALGSASWNFAAHSEVDQLTVCGTDGQIELPIFASGPVLITDGEGTREVSHEHPPHVQQPLIQSVVDDLLGRGSCPSTGESAWRTSQVMDNVLARYYGGRDDAFWERPATWPGRLQRET